VTRAERCEGRQQRPCRVNLFAENTLPGCNAAKVSPLDRQNEISMLLSRHFGVKYSETSTAIATLIPV